MRKIAFLIFILAFAGCTAYQKEVAKDCQRPSDNAGAVICVDEIPPYIQQYTEMLENDTLALFNHMRFIVEDESVDWVYRMESNKLRLVHRYRTPIISSTKLPLTILGCIGAGILLAIILGVILNNYAESMRLETIRRSNLADHELITAQATKEAAREMQKAGVTTGTRESDLIAKQAMLIDSLSEQNDNLVLEETERVKEINIHRTFNGQIYSLALEAETLPAKGKKEAHQAIADKILNFVRDNA